MFASPLLSRPLNHFGSAFAKRGRLCWRGRISAGNWGAPRASHSRLLRNLVTGVSLPV